MLHASAEGTAAPISRHGGEAIVVLEVGSSRVACALAEADIGKPRLLAVEAVASYGLRGGEVIDLERAAESIRIVVQAVADRAEADVRSVVVGCSGEVRMSLTQGTLPLGGECPAVTESHVERLRKSLHPEGGRSRRLIHRFDGPYRVGELAGIERPVGLCGPTLTMASSFLTVPSDRLENLLRAVRAAGVEIENVAVEPLAASYGALSDDERGLGAAVLDFAGGGFRGALWEGGRLRQLCAIGQDSAQGGGVQAGLAGLEAVVSGVARHFRIAPTTARGLIRAHGAVGDAAPLPDAAPIEVPAVDELARIRIAPFELAKVLEAQLVPVLTALREGLGGFSRHHAAGVVLVGQGAALRGLPDCVSRVFGGAPVRQGIPRWEPAVAESVGLPVELDGPGGCGLCGLIVYGHQARARYREARGETWWTRLNAGLKRVAASL